MPVVRLLLLAGIMAHKARMSAPGLGRAKKLNMPHRMGQEKGVLVDSVHCSGGWGRFMSWLGSSKWLLDGEINPAYEPLVPASL